MTAAVLHVNTAARDARSSTMRVADFVAAELGIPLVHDVETANQHRDARPDALFVRYGPWDACDHRDAALRIMESAGRVVQLENDYLPHVDRRFRAPDEVWSTIEGRTRYVNWNVLTPEGADAWSRSPRPLRAPMLPGLYYYGSWRIGRLSDLYSYLGQEDGPIPPYTVHLHTAPLAAAVFAKHKIRHDRLRNVVSGDISDCDRYDFMVYIEDQYSHTHYTSPATRFYESVMYGATTLFDVDALGTLHKGGIHVPMAWQTAGMTGVKKILSKQNVMEIRAKQRRLWWRDYGVDLRAQLRDAIRASFGEL